VGKRSISGKSGGRRPPPPTNSRCTRPLPNVSRTHQPIKISWPNTGGRNLHQRPRPKFDEGRSQVRRMNSQPQSAAIPRCSPPLSGRCLLISITDDVNVNVVDSGRAVDRTPGHQPLSTPSGHNALNDLNQASRPKLVPPRWAAFVFMVFQATRIRRRTSAFTTHASVLYAKQTSTLIPFRSLKWRRLAPEFCISK